ncbi:hypothetical protein CTAYLR_001925 [Chrysophaeum taylorii]|uniref:2-oxoadipate dioxygenase/decarboxylase n=1 Tax=Chrysophaeum taylorii TaxID=2483200 RepID=A0AAD7UAL5_9STRA|nr:hypothetical protein CTAYLR_001925 [Chrysophaeum taylorii]
MFRVRKLHLYGERSRAKDLLETYVGAAQPTEGTALHASLGRERIGAIHHLALRGIKFEDGRHTLERTFAGALEAAGYVPARSGDMPAIDGSFIEWFPPGAPAVGLPEDPYVFTSMVHVDQLAPEAQAVLRALKPWLLGEQSRSDDDELPLSVGDYDILKQCSQYAAWHVTNTFIVPQQDAVNHLAYCLNDGSHADLTTCVEVNDFLVAKGWTLNTYAGRTVQAVEDETGYVFRQSSVVASPMTATFLGGGTRTIPGLFHEFVEHPMTLPFRGFSNAQALFSSTKQVQDELPAAAS